MEVPTTLTLGLILLLQTGCGLFENEQAPRFFTATPISAVEVALEIRSGNCLEWNYKFFWYYSKLVYRKQH